MTAIAHDWAETFRQLLERKDALDQHFHKPWSFEANGQEWTATGWSVGMLFVPGRHAGPAAPRKGDRHVDQPTDDKVIGILSKPTEPLGHWMLADLVSAAGPVRFPDVKPCPECGDRDGARCDDCDGQGRVTVPPPPRYLRIHGCYYDTRILAPIVGLLPPGPVQASRWTEDLKTLRVEGAGGWLVMVTPCFQTTKPNEQDLKVTTDFHPNPTEREVS